MNTKNSAGYYVNRHNSKMENDYKKRLFIVGKTMFGEVVDHSQIKIIKRNISLLFRKFLGEEDIKFFEFGCGTGIISEIIMQLRPNCHYYASDPVHENVRVSKKALSKNLNAEVNVGAISDAENLNLQDSVIILYEVIQHLDANDVRTFVDRAVFSGCKLIIFGGVPDLNNRANFYFDRSEVPDIDSNFCDSVIGSWWSKAWFSNLSGVKAYFFEQNKLYTAHYRFDVVLVNSNV